MADSEAPGDSGAEEKLKLTIKASQRSLEVELSVDATVKEVGRRGAGELLSLRPWLQWYSNVHCGHRLLTTPDFVS